MIKPLACVWLAMLMFAALPIRAQSAAAPVSADRLYNQGNAYARAGSSNMPRCATSPASPGTAKKSRS